MELVVRLEMMTESLAAAGGWWGRSLLRQESVMHQL